MFAPLLKFAIPVIGQYDLLIISNKIQGIKLYLVRHLVQTDKDLNWAPTPGPLPGYRASSVPFSMPKIYDPVCWDKLYKPPWWGYFQPNPYSMGACTPHFAQIPALMSIRSPKVPYGRAWATPFGPVYATKPVKEIWGPWLKWVESGVSNKSYSAANFNAGTTWWLSPTKPLLILQTGFYKTNSGIGNPFDLGKWGVSVSLNGSLVPKSWLPAAAPNKLQLQGGVGQIIVPGPTGGYEVHDVTGEYLQNQGTKNFPYPLYRMKAPPAMGDFEIFSTPGGATDDTAFLALRFGSNLDAPWKLEDAPPGNGMYFLSRASLAQFVVDAS